MNVQRIANVEWTPDNVTNIIYKYMVQGESASTVISQSLRIPETAFMKSSEERPKIWRKIEPVYKWFGFMKKYQVLPGGDTPYRRINPNKLYTYVSNNWNKRCSEGDLLAYFPEIADDLALAKKIYNEKENAPTGSGTGRKINYRDPSSLIPDDNTIDNNYYADPVTRIRRNTGTRSSSGRMPSGRSYRNFRSGNSYSSLSSSGPSIPGILMRVLLVAAVCAGIFFLAKQGISMIGNWSKSSSGKPKTTFGKKYNVNSYDYANFHYLGGDTKGTPKGINIRYEGVAKENSSIAIGDFKKDEINYEGVIYDKYNLTIGKLKKGVFTKSWCLSKNIASRDIVLAYYKKGSPSGVGILQTSDGETKIVNFSKGKSIIATYTNGEWIKPNGKQLKLKKDGSYKNITLIDDNRFMVKGLEINLDGDEFSYSSKVLTFSGNQKKFAATYISEKETIDIEYTSGEQLKMLLNSGGGSSGYTVTPSNTGN